MRTARARSSDEHQPAGERAPDRPPGLDRLHDTLVGRGPELRHRGEECGPDGLQIAAQGEDAAVEDAAALAQRHHLELAFVGVPGRQDRKDALLDRPEPHGDLADVEHEVAVSEGDALGGTRRPHV